MRVAIYSRVSTDDRDQTPETQLVPLREFAQAQESWQVVGEWVDHASATDQRRRVQWRDLLGWAARRKVDLLLIYRIDRAFRSVHDAAVTLEQLRAWGVGLRSYAEPWIDTTSPFGEALYYITVAYAGLERGILATRVKDGMARAKKDGKSIGRPEVPVNLDLVKQLRAAGKGWRAIQKAHPLVTLPSGKRTRPGVTTIRRAWEVCQNGDGVQPPAAVAAAPR